MTTLQVNDVLHFTEDGHRERLLWLDPAMEGGWFINIDQYSAVPIWRREVELDEFFTAKLAALATDPWAGGGVAITEVQARRRDIAASDLADGPAKLQSPRFRLAVAMKLGMPSRWSRRSHTCFSLKNGLR